MGFVCCVFDENSDVGSRLQVFWLMIIIIGFWAEQDAVWAISIKKRRVSVGIRI